MNCIMRQIGPDATSTEVEETYKDYDLTEWTRDLSHLCPSLKTIDFNGSVRRLDVFVENAENRGAKIEQMSLWTLASATSSRFFFDTLCNPGHPLTENLLALKIQFAWDDENIEFENDEVQPEVDLSFLYPIRGMLQHNRTLHRVNIGFTCSTDVCDYVRLKTSQLLYRFVRTPVAVAVKTQQDWRRRIAFLSVVNHTSSSAQQLDGLMLTKIFKYAMETRKRDVSISVEMN